MRVGVVLHQQKIGEDPGVLRAFAETAEELGFRHIIAYDHVLGAEHARRDPPLTGPYTEDTAFHEPLMLFSWWAALTERIEFVPGVIVLPQRQTALVAKQIAQLEILAAGRVRVGVGIGWNFVEYESLGVPYRQRGARLEEQVDVMRRLWTERLLDYTGKFHRIDRAGLQPLLGHPVPVWFGGYSDAQHDRCARIGDGFLWGRSSSLAYEAMASIRTRAAEHGRDPAALGFEEIINSGPETWTNEIARWSAAGGTHASIHPDGEGRGLIDGLRDAADRLGGLLG